MPQLGSVTVNDTYLRQFSKTNDGGQTVGEGVRVYSAAKGYLDVQNLPPMPVLLTRWIVAVDVCLLCSPVRLCVC